MSEQSFAPVGGQTPAAMRSRDCVPPGHEVADAQPSQPAPCLHLVEPHCVLWALALHHAAVVARLSGVDQE